MELYRQRMAAESEAAAQSAPANEAAERALAEQDELRQSLSAALEVLTEEEAAERRERIAAERRASSALPPASRPAALRAASRPAALRDLPPPNPAHAPALHAKPGGA